jgi:hypothetical protein
MILLYSSSGISPSISAAATVVERLISFWMTTIIGFLVLPFYGEEALDKISSVMSSDEEEITEEFDEENSLDEKYESNSNNSKNSDNTESSSPNLKDEN